MKRFRKSVCMLLSLCVLTGFLLIPTGEESLVHSEDPLLQQERAAHPASDLLAPTEPVIVETEPQVPEEPEITRPRVSSENMGFNGIPIYYQTDYPDDIYGFSTIADSGCSATCLAMVASYMTGYEYLPDEIARYFGGAAENNIARLEIGSETLQLPFRKAKNWHETIAAIQEGKIAILLMGAKSLFTDSQHFILVTGINSEGKIMVNDPLKSNYDKWDIKRGLQEGFDKEDLLLGYSGAWIYDKSAMPEEPFLYYEPEPVRGECRYDFELTQEEIRLLAKLVWVEAQGESNEGQQAVAEVVLNRIASDKFPNNLRDVVYSENQFRSAKFLKDAQPYQLQYEMVDNAMYGPYVLPEDVHYFATTAKTNKVWGKIGGHIFCYSEY
ncbi:MAG: cell wall hydrolase [Oscillospiraceae bacterium]|nr:cell wall hydrolase [Oscillospiraceae bacterium]